LISWIVVIGPQSLAFRRWSSRYDSGQDEVRALEQSLAETKSRRRRRGSEVEEEEQQRRIARKLQLEEEDKTRTKEMYEEEVRVDGYIKEHVYVQGVQ
jgi:hypothetical protein